jgi:hypothetical protein
MAWDSVRGGMIHKLFGGARWRHGLRLCFAVCAFSSLYATSSCMAEIATPRSPYLNEGLRWIGTAPACRAPADWTAERLFRSSRLPAGLAELCVYTWIPARAAAPTATEIGALFTVSGANEMTEDVPVVLPSVAFSTEDVALFAGLRTALRAQVGDSSLLPSLPASPEVRVVVIDTAPDAPDGAIQAGTSRHGDTLAHLIEDLVCQIDATGVRTCAAEVTTELALPWITRTFVPGPHGGYIGTLSDLARAIDRAVFRWQSGRLTKPPSPARLLLNLSLGWEDTPQIADCSAGSPTLMGPPARAVRGILQYAASQGALIVAAAGNDSGGPSPRQGLVCPGRYQAVRQDTDPSQALLVAVSGVDYQDHPLQTVRPLGITGIAGLGIHGVAWDSHDPVPAPLTGSSVSTAVVSAVSALVWAYGPGLTPGQVTAAVYTGGVDLTTVTMECPLLLGQCRSHRASVCGALKAAGAPLSCLPAAPQGWSSPSLPNEIAALDAAFSSLLPSSGTSGAAPLPIPRDSVPTVQIQPWTFPMPIAETCPPCRLVSGHLSIPPRGHDLHGAVLVIRFTDGTMQSVALNPQHGPLASHTSYSFVLPNIPTSQTNHVQSAYITAFGFPQPHPSYSITEQIFVQP